jgi:hypothetical protein
MFRRKQLAHFDGIRFLFVDGRKRIVSWRGWWHPSLLLPLTLTLSPLKNGERGFAAALCPLLALHDVLFSGSIVRNKMQSSHRIVFAGRFDLPIA